MERTCSAKLNIHIMLVDGVCRRESFGNGYLCMCGKQLCNEANNHKLANTHVFYIFFLLSTYWLLWLRWRHAKIFHEYYLCNSYWEHVMICLNLSSATNKLSMWNSFTCWSHKLILLFLYTVYHNILLCRIDWPVCFNKKYHSKTLLLGILLLVC